MTEQPPPDVMFASLVDKFKELDTDRSAPTSRQAFAELLQKAGYGAEGDTEPHDTQDASWYAFVKWVLEETPAARPEEAPSGAAAATAAAAAAAPLDSVSQALRPQPSSAAAGVEGMAAKERESVAATGAPTAVAPAAAAAEESRGVAAMEEEESVARGAPTVTVDAPAAAAAEDLEQVPDEVALPDINEDEFMMYDFLNPFDLADADVAPRNPSVLDTQGSTSPGFRTTMRWSTKQPNVEMMKTNDSEFWQDVSAPSAKGRESQLALDRSSVRTRMKSEISFGSWMEQNNTVEEDDDE